MASRRQGPAANPFGTEAGEGLSIEDADRALFGDMDPMLTIDEMRLDGGTQPRARLDQSTINEYAEAMLNGDRFPPVVAFYDGQEHWLADGFHRVAAARAAGLAQVRAEIRQGTQRDAVLHSVGVNAQHGLRRANADKRRAVETLLRDEVWRDWSDREIARRARVSQPFVGKVRAEMYPVSDNGYQMDERKVQRGDSTYTMQTGGIREAANEARTTPPSGPLPAGREGERGVSSETPEPEPLDPFPVGEEEFVPAEHTKLMLAAIRHTLFALFALDLNYVTVGALCDRTDLTAAQVVQVCGELVERGLLEELPGSKWRPVTPPPDPLPAGREGEVEPPGVAELLQELLGLTHALKNHLTEVAEGREVVPVEYRDGVADQMYDVIDYVNGVMHAGGKYERGVLDLIDAVFALWTQEEEADEA